MHLLHGTGLFTNIFQKLDVGITGYEHTCKNDKLNVQNV